MFRAVFVLPVLLASAAWKAPLQGAAESSAACGGYSETEQVQRSQNASVLQRTQRDAGTANRRLDAPQGAA